MALGNILDIVLAIRIKESQFWWEPPPSYFPINSSGGVASHPGYPAQLPCSYITVTLYNSSITLLDRVTALCKARPLDASRHPFQPGPLQATHHGLLKPYKMNTGGTYALSLRVGAP